MTTKPMGRQPPVPSSQRKIAEAVGPSTVALRQLALGLEPALKGVAVNKKYKTEAERRRATLERMKERRRARNSKGKRGRPEKYKTEEERLVAVRAQKQAAYERMKARTGRYQGPRGRPPMEYKTEAQRLKAERHNANRRERYRRRKEAKGTSAY
jgi:hypothetical protein